MSKPGPNQPCPCGSGKKYKKCCFLKGGAPSPSASKRPEPTRPLSYDEIAKKYGSGSAYAVARTVQERTPARSRGGDDGPVLIRDLVEMSTDAILGRLSAMGITLTQEQLVTAAKGEKSAWELSRRWRADIPTDRPREHDFVALAVCELWKRWRPEPPSMEMVDDWMAEGYDCVKDGDLPQACEHWWRVWLTVRGWLTPEMRTLSQTEAAFQGSQSMYDWLQDFAMHAAEAASESRVAGEHGRDFVLQCLAQLPDEGEDRTHSMRRELAEIHAGLGDLETGRSILEDMIAKAPRSCAAYAVLADILYQAARTPEQVHEALDVLLRAREAKVADGPDYDLDRRIKELRELKPKRRD